MQKLQYEDTYPITYLFSVGDENTELEIKVGSDSNDNPFSFLQEDDLEYFKQHSLDDALAGKDPKYTPKRFCIRDAKSIPAQMLVFVEFEVKESEEEPNCYHDNPDGVTVVDVIAWQKGSRLICHGRWRLLLFPNEVIRVINYLHDPYNHPRDWAMSDITIEYRAYTSSGEGDVISDDDPDWGDDDDD